MRLRAALPGALVAGALALAPAGCGGGSDGGRPRADRVDASTAQAYVRRVDRAERSLTAAFGEVQGGLGTTATPAELSTALGAFAAATTRTAQALRAAGPPAPVAGPHATLVAAVASYASAIARVRRDLEVRPDAQGALAASAALGEAADEAGARITTARKAIDSALTG